MSQPLWQFALYDASDNWLTDLSLGTGRTITFQLRAPHVLTMQLPLTSRAAGFLAAGDTYVKGYRTPAGGRAAYDQVLRFHGPAWIDDLQGGGSGNGVDTIKLTAMSPMIYLAKRFTTEAYPSATDRGTIILDLLDATNDDDDTGIATDAAQVASSSTTTVDWSDAKVSLLEVIDQFGAALDGCDAEIEPIEYDDGKIGRLVVHDSQGSDRSDDVVFGYGPATIANCLGMNRVRNAGLIDNDVLGYSDTVSANWINSTSIARYRRQYADVSYTGETSEDEISSRTKGWLDDHETLDAVAEYALTAGPRAPRLFDDFEIGDRVSLWFAKGAVEFAVAQRVYAATLAIADAGVETISGLETKQR